MDFRETVGEGLKENNKNITGNRKKGDPFYIKVESLATLSVCCVKVADVHKEL